MKTALSKLNHVVAPRALLPLAALCSVHEKLHVRITGAESRVARVLALNISLILAENTSYDILLDVFRADELGALGIRAIGRIRRSQLLDLEVKVLDELLRQHGTADFKTDWLLAAAWREQGGV